MPSMTKQIKTFLLDFDFKSKMKQFYQDCIRMPLYLLTHPIKGFDEFKREKTSKSYVAWFYLVMMILYQVIAFNATGFLVNRNNPKDFNLFLTISLIIFPVAMGTIGNWASTALMDGKGTMTEIFRVICYSFFPIVWLGLTATIISNFITVDEIIFYTFFLSLGTILTGYMMFFGLMGIHEYGLFKNILMLGFTIVAIAVILFVMLLFLSLLQQTFSFIQSVYSEFVMRFL